ncbi:MAG TPA: hypothetical protein VFK60_10675, partial [Casimicrobiaceae bacterium]|nr:hypothetical protein [Casimicrobiaceae bacterium]
RAPTATRSRTTRRESSLWRRSTRDNVELELAVPPAHRAAHHRIAAECRDGERVGADVIRIRNVLDAAAIELQATMLRSGIDLPCVRVELRAGLESVGIAGTFASKCAT